MCKTFFVATMGEGGYVLLASNGWKPEILLKTLKCTGHAPYTHTHRTRPLHRARPLHTGHAPYTYTRTHTHRNGPAQDVSSSEAVKPIWK